MQYTLFNPIVSGEVVFNLSAGAEPLWKHFNGFMNHCLYICRREVQINVNDSIFVASGGAPGEYWWSPRVLQNPS